VEAKPSKKDYFSRRKESADEGIDTSDPHTQEKGIDTEIIDRAHEKTSVLAEVF
jgi:hypothetical protein